MTSGKRQPSEIARQLTERGAKVKAHDTEMRHPLVLDGRQSFDRPRLTRAGFRYVGIVS